MGMAQTHLNQEVVIKDNKAYVRKNKRMREGKQDPTHTGTAKIDGKMYWVNAWMDDDKTPEGQPVVDEHGKQEKVLSCSFQLKENQEEGVSRPQASESVPPHGDEDEWGL